MVLIFLRMITATAAVHTRNAPQDFRQPVGSLYGRGASKRLSGHLRASHAVAVGVAPDPLSEAAHFAVLVQAALTSGPDPHSGVLPSAEQAFEKRQLQHMRKGCIVEATIMLLAPLGALVAGASVRGCCYLMATSHETTTGNVTARSMTCSAALGAISISRLLGNGKISTTGFTCSVLKRYRAGATILGADIRCVSGARAFRFSSATQFSPGPRRLTLKEASRLQSAPFTVASRPESARYCSPSPSSTIQHAPSPRRRVVPREPGTRGRLLRAWVYDSGLPSGLRGDSTYQTRGTSTLSRHDDSAMRDPARRVDSGEG
jgi:hypothetical protein